jgi:hypothetical protein
MLDSTPVTTPCPTSTTITGTACVVAKVRYPDGDVGILINTLTSGTWTFGF